MNKKPFIEDLDIANMLLSKYDEKLDSAMARNRELLVKYNNLVVAYNKLVGELQDVMDLLDDYD